MLETNLQSDERDWFLQINLFWLQAQIEERFVHANESKRHSTAL